MIEKLHVRHFQSLDDVEVELGGLTIIVGPSSSGKSALTRSLRVLIENQRGTSFISHGERIASITARTSAGTVTLQRGKAADDNSYTIIPDDPGHKLAPQAKFTKLGGATPEEVSEFIGINPNDPIAFASQFDKPYLLDEKPPEVARVLGELTNVRVIFDGARESNRQKLEASRTLRIRTEDLAGIKAKVPGYRALKAQGEALDEAEAMLAEAVALAEEIAEIEQAIDAVEMNRSRVQALKPLTEIEIPDEQELVAIWEQMRSLSRDIKIVLNTEAEVEQAQMEVEQDNDTLQIIDEEYAELLGQVQDDMAGWVAGYVADLSRTRSIEGTRYIEEAYVVEMMRDFIETRSLDS